MSKTQDLANQNAAAKIKEMIDKVRVVMFCCNLGQPPMDVTPMSPQDVDEDGTVWFFSTRESDRNNYLKKDKRTQLLLSNPDNTDHLSIYGETEFVQDLEKIKELWSPFAKVWFQGGPEDPKLTLLKFTPSEGYYWDTKHGKMVAFAKMAASIVTGKTMDDGVSGELKL